MHLANQKRVVCRSKKERKKRGSIAVQKLHICTRAVRNGGIRGGCPDNIQPKLKKNIDFNQKEEVHSTKFKIQKKK